MTQSTPYVVLDTETCSLEGGVVEIATVHENGMYDESLLSTDVPMSVEARATHHIDPVDLVGKPTIEDYLTNLGWRDAREPILVAHNAPFDSTVMPSFTRSIPKNLMLKQRATELHVPIEELEGPRTWICTYRCASHLWPEAPRHSNQVLRYWLDLDVSDMPASAGLTPHRALYDAWVTHALLKQMLLKHSLESLVRLSGQPVLLQGPVKFGKHAGQSWESVPHAYLSWIARGGMDNPDVVHTARHWLGA